MLRIVGQDGIDHEALKEIEDCPHGGEGLCREVVMGRVKRQHALKFGLIQTEQIGLRCGCFFELCQEGLNFLAGFAEFGDGLLLQGEQRRFLGVVGRIRSEPFLDGPLVNNLPNQFRSGGLFFTYFVV